MFGEDPTDALNDNFDEAGYSSQQFLRNIGSIFIFMLIFPTLGFIGFLLLKIEKLPDKLRLWISKFNDMLFFNGVLGFLS